MKKYLLVGLFLWGSSTEATQISADHQWLFCKSLYRDTPLGLIASPDVKGIIVEQDSWLMWYQTDTKNLQMFKGPNLFRCYQVLPREECGPYIISLTTSSRISIPKHWKIEKIEAAEKENLIKIIGQQSVEQR